MTEEELTARLRRTMPEYLKGILSSDDVESDLNEAAGTIAELRREREVKDKAYWETVEQCANLESDNTALKERVARLEVALRRARDWFADPDQGTINAMERELDAALDVKGAG